MKVLIITDLQNDFMPGGVLGVPGADQIVSIVNRLIPRFEHIIATLDWHPENHISFASTHGKKPKEMVGAQVLWPDHCIRDSRGAALVDELHQERIEARFYKGTDPQADSYSAFFDDRRRSTGLGEYLKKKKMHELYFCGVATDYCVLYSVLDALQLGFSVAVIRDACRAVELKKGDEERALHKMEERGARIALSSEFI